METTTLDSEARRLAGEIATEIRVSGHFQGLGDRYDDTHPEARSDPRCVLANPPMWRIAKRGSAHDRRVRDAFLDLLRDEAGIPGGTADWNDSTPTDEVLACLDKIAAGG